MTAETVLAWMLALFAPGQSAYSLVDVAEGSPAPCERRYDPLCRKPWYDAHHKGFVRVETKAEGRQRYELIAGVIAEQAAGDVELARLVTTVAFHESGFRRDSHSGIGAHAKGDGGRSWCLVQVMLGKSGRGKARTGVPAYKLVGVDRLSTERCIGSAVHDLHLLRGRGVRTPRGYFMGYGGIRPEKISARAEKFIRAREATYAKLTALGRGGK